MAFPKITIQVGADTSRLNRDLKKGETTIQKFGRGAMRAMDGLALAATGAAFAIGKEGVEAAIADQAAQVKLATTLKNTTKATDAQVASVEDYINQTQLATGVVDDDLRPSLDRLVRSTKDVKRAQELQALALDVSAGTGKDLQSVTEAIAKAYDGSFTSLKRLGIPLDENIIKTKDFDAAQKVLAKTFEGQSAAAAATAEGGMRRFQIVIDEAKESIGEALLPTLEELTDYVTSPEGQKLIKDFAEGMGDAFKAAAQALPPILAGLKEIGKSAAAMNIDFSTFADPKLMAAATAFRLTPGPIQIKAIAALAAYGAIGAAADADRAAMESFQSADPNKIYAYGVPGRTAINAAQQNYMNALTTGQRMQTAPAFSSLYGTQPQVVNNIRINAIDPVQTARQIAKITNGQNGNASSPKFQAFLR